MEKLDFNTSAEVVTGLADNQNQDAPQWAKDLMDKLNKVEALADKTNKAVEGLVKTNAALSSRVDSLTSKVTKLEEENVRIKSENCDLHEKLLLLEYHQRRNNLVFDGIPEVNGMESGRDCFDKLISYLSHLPDFDVSCIRIDRCHRLGAKQQ